jgi:predicted nucleotidyltransferase
MMDKVKFIQSIVEELKKIPNITAIVIGGSYANGTNRLDSDIDLGLYYKEASPFSINEIKSLANKLNDFPDSLVSDFGGWGKWVNGGTWLTIKEQRVDFIYRNLDFVKKIINESIERKIQSDYYQEPPQGFHSYIYLAEIASNKILYDPENIITHLKNKVKTYPPKLKNEIINVFLWDCEFALSRAQKFTERNEIHLVVSSLSRINHNLIQVLYALNETYFFSVKKTYKDFPLFNKTPKDFLQKVEQVLGNIGTTNDKLRKSLQVFSNLIEECKLLTKDIYIPKYSK